MQIQSRREHLSLWASQTTWLSQNTEQTVSANKNFSSSTSKGFALLPFPHKKHWPTSRQRWWPRRNCSMDCSACLEQGHYSILKPVDAWADMFWPGTFWCPPRSSHISGPLANLFLQRSPWTMRKHIMSNCFHHQPLTSFCWWEEFQGADTPQFHLLCLWAFHITWQIQGEIQKDLHWQPRLALRKCHFHFTGFTSTCWCHLFVFTPCYLVQQMENMA